VDAYGALCKKVADSRGHLPTQATPDVRDPPEDKSADVGVADMNNGWRGGLLHGGREPMRGAERGSERFTLSHLFCEFPWLWCCCWCLVVVCWVVAFLCFLVVFSLPQKFLL